jgi:hypothetical protein
MQVNSPVRALVGMLLAGYNPAFAVKQSWADSSSPFFLLERFLLVINLLALFIHARGSPHHR